MNDQLLSEVESSKAPKYTRESHAEKAFYQGIYLPGNAAAKHLYTKYIQAVSLLS